ncbi:MAG: hypothetical protein KU38_06000 [Sulfurovum sp. FS08-3]|nr:MAG: hypothetical protein KU38_06000 [Sulfurovum sp. FS08-3]
MLRYGLIGLSLMLLLSCSSRPVPKEYIPTINKAMRNASPVGKRILKTAHSMSYTSPKVVRGSCWDYINAIYIRSGYGYKNQTIFKGGKGGPFAPIYAIESGDWLYHINREYRGIEHSGIFIDWIDLERRKALMISYRGMGSGEPARYQVYTLSHVYNIKRGY